MKHRATLTLLVLALLLALMLPAQAEIEMPALQDLITQHRVLLVGEADSYSVYQIVYFGSDTHTLLGVTCITRFTENSGVTEDLARSFDASSAYPGIDRMSFVSTDVYTAGGCVNFAVCFTGLDKTENKKAMVDSGYLLMTDPSEVLTSDAYVESLNQYGSVREVPLIDYDKLGFKF